MSLEQPPGHEARHREFIRFCNGIDREVAPDLEVHPIADNHASHKHLKVKTWPARHPQAPSSKKSRMGNKRWNRDARSRSFLSMVIFGLMAIMVDYPAFHLLRQTWRARQHRPGLESRAPKPPR